MFSRQSGDEAGFAEQLGQCFFVLDQMNQRGLHFDPQLAQVYQQLAQVYQQLAGMFGAQDSE